MTALHGKASQWVRRGIFRNLASFEEFTARVNRIAEEKDRGRQRFFGELGLFFFFFIA